MGEARYTYTAQCPKAGKIWQLPRTEEAELMAIALMSQLAALSDALQADAAQKGALYGVLIAQTQAGDRVVLKGASGVLSERDNLPGWVPSLPMSVQMALAEIKTLATLDQLKADLLALEKLPIRAVYEQNYQQYAAQLDQLVGRHRGRKRERDHARTHYHKTLQGEALTNALKVLTCESQQESTARRRFKQARDQALAPLANEIAQADHQIEQLKQHYSTLSQTWQQQMKSAYVAERDGANRCEELGECPDNVLSDTCYQRAGLKLVYHALTHQLTPLSLAEFWWGASEGDYVSGQFYGASEDECQALMCLATKEIPSVLTDFTLPLPIIYEDEFLRVVDKPAGLLSVPGRRYHLQDSVLSRLRYQLPNHSFLQLVHRLDQATSGLVVVATSAEAHAGLSQQFAQRQVRKTYEAVLSRPIDKAFGVLDLPLWRDLENRPRQLVDFQRGKPSRTEYRRLTSGDNPRVEMVPHTGRTHQLRVHTASSKGLNSPILGDVLYGLVQQDSTKPDLTEKFLNTQLRRLHLHATMLECVHPITGKALCLKSVVPF